MTEPEHSEKLLHEPVVLCRRLVNRSVHFQLPTAKRQDCPPLFPWLAYKMLPLPHRQCRQVTGQSMTRTHSLHQRQDTHEYFKLFGRQFPIFYQCLWFSQESFCNSNPEDLSVSRKALNTNRQNEWIYCKNQGYGDVSSAREHSSIVKQQELFIWSILKEFQTRSLAGKAMTYTTSMTQL